jgi:hypothetical protein
MTTPPVAYRSPYSTCPTDPSKSTWVYTCAACTNDNKIFGYACLTCECLHCAHLRLDIGQHGTPTLDDQSLPCNQQHVHVSMANSILF